MLKALEKSKNMILTALPPLSLAFVTCYHLSTKHPQDTVYAYYIAVFFPVLSLCDIYLSIYLFISLIA